MFALPGGKQVLKLAPLAEWTTRDVWYACEQFAIPLLPLYERGLSLRSAASPVRHFRPIPTIRDQDAGQAAK